MFFDHVEKKNRGRWFVCVCICVCVCNHCFNEEPDVGMRV